MSILNFTGGADLVVFGILVIESTLYHYQGKKMAQSNGYSDKQKKINKSL